MAFGIGALSGAAGGGAGNAVAGAFGTATTFGGAIANGALIGSAGGFAGGFVGSAGNAWMGGANFGQGLQSGIIGGAIGGLGGAVTGGISGGIQYQKQISIFSKGLNELGIDETGTVPATDDFLTRAQKVWYPDAPMNSVRAFTVENVPQEHLTGKSGLVTKGAFAKTVPLSKNGILTGNSRVYFNKDLAFSSAKTLFCKMGHEFVHVYQNIALTGKSASLFTNVLFSDMIELQAYTYENILGKIHYNSFTSASDHMIAFPDLYKILNYTNFGLPPVEAFKYPF